GETERPRTACDRQVATDGHVDPTVVDTVGFHTSMTHQRIGFVGGTSGEGQATRPAVHEHRSALVPDAIHAPVPDLAVGARSASAGEGDAIAAAGQHGDVPREIPGDPTTAVADLHVIVPMIAAGGIKHGLAADIDVD